jgi:hypothetical protein
MISGMLPHPSGLRRRPTDRRGQRHVLCALIRHLLFASDLAVEHFGEPKVIDRSLTSACWWCSSLPRWAPHRRPHLGRALPCDRSQRHRPPALGFFGQVADPAEPTLQGIRD